MAALKRTPWSYLPGNTPLHRCPAGIKLIFLLLLSAVSVWGFSRLADSGGAAPGGGGFTGAVCAASAFAVILAGSVLTGMNIRALFAGSRPLVIMLLFFTAFRVIGAEKEAALSVFSFFYLDIAALKSGLFVSAGILMCFASASLFFAATTTSELRVSLAKAELLLTRPFQKKDKDSFACKQGRLSLALALMLGFLPRFFEYWENSMLAVRARGCSGKVRAIIAILPLVTERMIEAASETAEALESRGLTV